MKAYREKSKIYHSKWQSLCVDKEVLKKEKRELEREVTRLREQLDTVSIASHSSVLSHHHRSLSYSCSSLNEKDLDANKFYYSSLNEKDLDVSKFYYSLAIIYNIAIASTTCIVQWQWREG